MARKGFPSDNQDQYMVRFPTGLRKRIKAAADANGRSMNAEIVARIEQTFIGWPSLKLPSSIIERAFAASPEERARYEIIVSQEALRIADEHFRSKFEDLLELYRNYWHAIDIVPFVEQEKIIQIFDSAFIALIDQLPTEMREKAYEFFDAQIRLRDDERAKARVDEKNG